MVSKGSLKVFLLFCWNLRKFCYSQYESLECIRTFRWKCIMAILIVLYYVSKVIAAAFGLIPIYNTVLVHNLAIFCHPKLSKIPPKYQLRTTRPRGTPLKIHAEIWYQKLLTFWRCLQELNFLAIGCCCGDCS